MSFDEATPDARTVHRTFLVADLVGYSALTDTHGDGAAADLVLEFVGQVRRALTPTAELVKLLGDGVLIATPDAAGALTVLDALFSSLAATNYTLAIRVGVHAGTAISVEGSDYLGATINVAARLAHEARPGEVMATLAVANVARARGDQVLDLGPRALRHIGDPVDTFGIALATIPAAAPLDPVCHMRLDGVRPEFSLLWAGRRIGFCADECATRFLADPDAYIDHVEDC